MTRANALRRVGIGGRSAHHNQRRRDAFALAAPYVGFVVPVRAVDACSLTICICLSSQASARKPQHLVSARVVAEVVRRCHTFLSVWMNC